MLASRTSHVKTGQKLLSEWKCELDFEVSYCLSENVSLKRSELGPQWQSGHEASFSCDSHRRLLLPDYFLAPHKLLSGQHDKAGERPTSLFSHNIFIVPSKFSESRNAKYLTQQICVNGNIQNLSLLTHRYIPYNVLHCTGHRVHPTPKKCDSVLLLLVHIHKDEVRQLEVGDQRNLSW